jgi:hypothetical protein
VCDALAVDSLESAGAPEHEIEVTPAMIDAGVKLLGDWYAENDDWFTRDRVCEFYRTLASRVRDRPNQKPA